MSALVVTCVASVELWLPLPGVTGVLHRSSPARGKDQTAKTRSTVSAECLLLLRYLKVKVEPPQVAVCTPFPGWEVLYVMCPPRTDVWVTCSLSWLSIILQ